MKKISFILLLFFLHTSGFSQIAIKEIPGQHTIDSCLIIAKQNPGWVIPDTAQFRSVAPKLKGFAYLTSSMYEGNYIEVERRTPLRKLIAQSMNINSPAFYNLVLIQKP